MSDTTAAKVAAHWGERVRSRRLNQGLSQTDFGPLVALDQSSVSRYELGKGAWTPDVQLAFAAALDIPVAELFAWPLLIDSVYRAGQPKTVVAS